MLIKCVVICILPRKVEYTEFVEMMRRPGDEPMRRDASEIWTAMMARTEKE